MVNADEFRPLPLHAPHDAAAARAEAEELLAEANRMHRDAQDKAHQLAEQSKADAKHAAAETRDLRTRTLAAANLEAESIVAAAKTDAARQEQNADKLDAWSMRVLMAATVGLTATGEYQLARMANFDPSVAWLFPLVIDVYVIQAFRRHRDVIQAITLTIAANVVYHLAASGLFGVTAGPVGHRQPTWWLIAGVASIASLILWRAHLINRPAKKTEHRAEVGAHLAGRPVRQSELRTEHEALSPALSVGAQLERETAPIQPGPEALTAGVNERAQTTPVDPPVERPAQSKTERPERAQTKPKKRAQKSAPKNVAERRSERVRALYTELGKRPEWGEIRDALAAAKLADKTISRSSCQRIRDAVESEHPDLAALGSENVRSITGG